MSTHPEFWIVLHTRTENDDPERLDTRGVCTHSQEEAFELLIEMACLSELRRAEEGLVYPKVDVLELCTRLKDLTGDDFECMVYEEFVTRRAKRQLPAALRIENLLEEPQTERETGKVTVTHREYRHRSRDVRIAPELEVDAFASYDAHHILPAKLFGETQGRRTTS